MIPILWNNGCLLIAAYRQTHCPCWPTWFEGQQPLKKNATTCLIISTRWRYYTNIDWCRGQHWKIMPRSCVMLPEGNTAQLTGIIFQCWSRLIVNICFVISRKTAFCTLPYRPIQTRNSHAFSLTRNICSNFCQRLYYFRILQFFEVYKRQKKTTYKPV